MEKVIAEHRVESDDGRIDIVVEHQRYLSSPAMGDDARQWTPGLKRLALRSGAAVMRIDDSTFQVVSTGEIMRKID